MAVLSLFILSLKLGLPHIVPFVSSAMVHCSFGFTALCPVQRHPADSCCAATYLVTSLLLKVRALLCVVCRLFFLASSEDDSTPISMLKMYKQCFGGT